MAGMKKLKGLDKVLSNLNKAIKKQRLNTSSGLQEAALVVKADSVKLTPIDLGNLRASSFVMVTGRSNPASPSWKSSEDSGKIQTAYSQAVSEGRSIVGKSDEHIVGIVAYGAYYALYVHETPMKHAGVPRTTGKGNYWDGGENQFLLKSLMKNKKRVLDILVKHAKV
jgi:hypothetical protein